jgi:transglutaminase-like putative cysteine protease
VRACFALIISTLILSAVPAFAQIYTWTDAGGTVNFCDNPGSIPAQYRKKAVPVGGDDKGPSPAATRPADTSKQVQIPPVARPSVYDADNRLQVNQPAIVPSAKTPLDTLADTLMKNARTDREKAYAAFEWIVQNIYYDKPELHRRRSGHGTGSQSAEAVLASKHAVCAGFANLFTALAGRMGLKSATVSGIAAGSRQEVHAWNAVMVDGKWGLVDTVYRHFLSPPEEFIAKHFPFDSQWQLLPKPITRAEWLKR